jgi:DNA-binding MarR family transcriptional regulator
MERVTLLRERFSLDDIDEELVAQGLLTFLFVHRLFEHTLSRTGLSFGEFIVLMHLRNRREELNLNQVKNNVLVFSSASITKIADKLVAGRLITRRVNPGSRREKLIKTTPAGNKTITKLIDDIKSQDKLLTRNLTADEKRLMVKMSDAILRNAVKLAKDL